MSFEGFVSAVKRKIAISGENVSVRFFVANGGFFAECSNGVRISGNPGSRLVTLRWGSRHMAQSYI